MSKTRKDTFSTHSGNELKEFYSPEDLPDFAPDRDLGIPGEFPYTRGVYPSMYRGKLWTMRQYAGFGTAEESNQRYRYLLEQGQTGLSVAFDLPTQLGLDSDHPLSRGEVGKVGVAIDSVEDMDILFSGIPLESVSVSMTINATAATILSMYLVLAEQRGIPWDRLNGTIQNDILKEYVARGTYIYPPQPSLRLITDTLSFCRQEVPNWNTMSISGYHIREAGATAVQELAFTFANALAYVEAAREAGMEVDAFAPRLSFFLSSHNHFLEEVAKFRAARRLWAKLMRDRFDARDPKSWKFRFHTQTSGVTLVAQEPDNNVVRVTLQALSSILGGTQSLHTNSRDEALALPSEESAHIALRTQQIIAHESGVADCVDPLGGAYCIEALTDQIESQVQAYLQKIQDIGGALAAIEQGYIQKEIQDSAYAYQKQIESQERLIVGLNTLSQDRDSPPFELYYPPEKVEKDQVKRLSALKASRDPKSVRRKLGALETRIQDRENTLPGIIDAVRARATLGEISDVFRGAFGTYTENVNL